MVKNCIYPLVQEAMRKQHMSIVALSAATGIEYRRILYRFKGNHGGITLDEAVIIRDAVAPGMPIEALFRRDEKC